LKEANIESVHHGFAFVLWKRFLSAKVIRVAAPSGRMIGEDERN
jgi:hypothetical protein